MNKHGLTLIELIMAIVIMSIIMIPVALISIEYAKAAVYADSITTASNLASREMSIVNNLSYSDPTLVNGYDNITKNYAGYNFDLRRTVSVVPGSLNNLKLVRTRIFPGGSNEQLVEFATYVIDVMPGAGSAGGALGLEGDSFYYAFGTLGRDVLTDVMIRNIRYTGNITMTGLIITTSIDKTVTYIRIAGENRFSGSVDVPANVPTRIDFQENFMMNMGISYFGSNGLSITFSKGLKVPYSLSLTFLFYDGSKYDSYMPWEYIP